MRIVLVFLSLIILSPVFAHAEPEIKGTPNELFNYLTRLPKEVTITGVAHIKIQSESGVARIGIRTENPKLQIALENNQTLRNKIIAKLINQGVAKSNIKGTKFSSIPEYGYFSKKPSNYIVENVLNISIQKEAELQKLAAIVDEYKQVFYQGFELKEQAKEQIRQQLSKKALADAKARKKIYEDDLSIVLKPIAFEESFSFEKPQLRQKHPKKNERSFSSLSKTGTHTDGLSLGQHIYHGVVEIRYFVIADKSK